MYSLFVYVYLFLVFLYFFTGISTEILDALIYVLQVTQTSETDEFSLSIVFSKYLILQFKFWKNFPLNNMTKVKSSKSSFLFFTYFK